MKNWVLCAVFIISFSLSGQVNIDSLQQVLDATKPTIENMDIYLEKMMSYGPNDIEIAQLIGDWVKNSAEKENFPESEANSYLYLSHSYIKANNYSEATKNLIEAERIAEKNKLFIIQARIYNARAIIYNIYRQQDKAIETHKKSLALCEKIDYQKGIAISKYNLSGLYLQIGWPNPSADTIQLSLKLNKEAIEIAKRIKDTTNIIKYSSGIITGLCYAEEYDEAINILSETERILKASGNKFAYIDYYMSLGVVYGEKKEYSKALEYYYKALEVSKEQKSPLWIYNAYSQLGAVYEVLGNYKEANKYNILYSKVHDSLINAENYSYTADLQNRYEREKKQKEVVELKSQNQKKETLNYILIGSSIALLLIVFLGYRNFSHKRKLQNLKITELEKDKQLFAIDAMLKGQEEERSRIAKDLHDGLGGLLSGTKLSFIHMKENLILTPENAAQFDSSLSMLDNTIADLRKVAQNLMPEALVKFGLNEALRDFCNTIQSSSKITVDYQNIGVDRKLNNTAEVFVYRIVQELVNNAIKHSKSSEIMVQLALSEAKTSITVEDNGIGYDKEIVQNKKGSGLDNIKYRVNYLNGTIDTRTSINNGTSVNIELNV